VTIGVNKHKMGNKYNSPHIWDCQKADINASPPKVMESLLT
jgi:hypothetical protein